MTDTADHHRNSLWPAPTHLAMPPKGGDASLTDDDLKAVIDYMKKAFGR
jgi:cytochrome c5